jgi:hypothetical protein
MLVGALLAGCETSQAFVILENAYPPSATRPLVVYRAVWQAVAFQAPLTPGASSEPQSTVPASCNTAYAILAPGWNPTGSTPPTSFIVLQSSRGFAVDVYDTLHIPVDDSTFSGNCAWGSFLTQAEADFITQIVFPDVFAALRYDAATCSTQPLTDAGAP